MRILLIESVLSCLMTNLSFYLAWSVSKANLTLLSLYARN